VRTIRSTVLAAVLAAALMPATASAAAQSTPCNAQVAGGDWPSYGHDPANTRSQPAEHGIGPAEVPTLAPAWVFSTRTEGDKTGFNSTPAVYRGCVFVGSAGGTAYALNASDGHIVWQRKIGDFNASAGGAMVGGAAVAGRAVVFLVNGADGPYAVALDRSTGSVLWRSVTWITGTFSGTQGGYMTISSPVVANGLVVGGYSGPEGDSKSTGGFALLDAATGKVVKVTPTIPPADQAAGYAGGGLWSTPAYDPDTHYLYWGAGNPNSKTKEHPNTNAILKIDLDRTHPTFGQIVDSYKGNVDQYSGSLETLSHTPVCGASDVQGAPYPLDDPACGQIDLDFGASANLFTTSSGRKVVGDLQKSGVYHVADTGTMDPVWSSLVGVSCETCNAASAAFDGSSVDGVATPGGQAYSLDRDAGKANWLAPIGDGTHFQSTSVADGVVWVEDANGFLDAFDAKTGAVLAKRALSADVGDVVLNGTSSGVAIAEHTVFAEGGGYAYSSDQVPGFVIAYRPQP
jgi:polyvinyl alcohol dehydrogenase (cytochrome)